jgi:hypothetical protein
MSDYEPRNPASRGTVLGIFAFFVALIATVVGYYWWSAADTMPKLDTNEGFAGPVAGAGAPDCLRTSSEAAQLYELMSSKEQTTETGPDDLRELQLLLSKMACFKRDLMSAAGVVQATYQQPFSTSHDIEPIAETTARCFAKTLPQRDLQISFDKWKTRGVQLIKRLCTSENLTDSEEKKAASLFDALMADVADIAMTTCCSAGDAIIAGESVSKRYGGYSPPAIQGLSEYKGLY